MVTEHVQDQSTRRTRASSININVGTRLDTPPPCSTGVLAFKREVASVCGSLTGPAAHQQQQQQSFKQQQQHTVRHAHARAALRRDLA